MKIINRTTNTVLATEALIADSYFKRLKGLLGVKELRRNAGLVIRPCNSVHTFFMRFPIDVLFVDKNNRIIKTIPHLKPYCFTALYFGAVFVIELPAGTIEATSTQENHTIFFS